MQFYQAINNTICKCTLTRRNGVTYKLLDSLGNDDDDEYINLIVLLRWERAVYYLSVALYWKETAPVFLALWVQALQKQ